MAKSNIFSGVENILIFSGKSATGKTFIARTLDKRMLSLHFAIGALSKLNEFPQGVTFIFDEIVIQDTDYEKFVLMRENQDNLFILFTQDTEFPDWVYDFAMIWAITPLFHPSDRV